MPTQNPLQDLIDQIFLSIQNSQSNETFNDVYRLPIVNRINSSTINEVLLNYKLIGNTPFFTDDTTVTILDSLSVEGAKTPSIVFSALTAIGNHNTLSVADPLSEYRQSALSTVGGNNTISGVIGSQFMPAAIQQSALISVLGDNIIDNNQNCNIDQSSIVEIGDSNYIRSNTNCTIIQFSPLTPGYCPLIYVNANTTSTFNFNANTINSVAFLGNTGSTANFNCVTVETFVNLGPLSSNAPEDRNSNCVVNFNDLESIGGYLHLVSEITETMNVFSFPSLQHVEEKIYCSKNAPIFPALVTCGGGITIQSVDEDCEVDLSSLTSVETVEIEYNKGITSIDLSSLATIENPIEGMLWLPDNINLEFINFKPDTNYGYNFYNCGLPTGEVDRILILLDSTDRDPSTLWIHDRLGYLTGNAGSMNANTPLAVNAAPTNLGKAAFNSLIDKGWDIRRPRAWQAERYTQNNGVTSRYPYLDVN